jgi:molybdate transport system substrate-binding protein
MNTQILNIRLRLFLVVVPLALLAACAAPAVPTAATTVLTMAPTVVPTLPEPTAKTLTVFAAASLKESFSELGKQFEALHPGVKVAINLANSQQLRTQLEEGALADVFASANTKEMNAAIQSSLVVSGTQKTFARNRLVVIYPKDNPGQLAALADLSRSGLKLDIADKAVPVGQYTLDMLSKMSADPAFGQDFRANVLRNVVSYENDVKAVVSKVSLGEADAGVVYSTDVTAAVAPKLGTLEIPDEFNQLATYPIAALVAAPEPDLAAQFVDLVLSDAGQQVLQSYGFILPK